MTKVFATLFAVLLGLAAWTSDAHAQVEQQRVVNSSLATVERMKNDQNFQKEFQPKLNQSKGVLIIPSLFKGGLIFGGQYGNGILLAHKPDGAWSYPAFYTISGGSFGLQIGITDSSILFIVMTEKGMNAMMDSQFKFGADSGITFVVVGAGMGASTTTAFGADIYAFSLGGVGLYGGLSLEGTVVSPRESWNSAYYGSNVASRAIVKDGQASNPAADKLRDLLSR